MAANPATSATLRADSMTLEQRRKRAEAIGKRVSGPVLLRDSRTTCARCGGARTINLPCPNCSRGSDGELEPTTLSAPSFNALADAKMDVARWRAGLPAARKAATRSTGDAWVNARLDLARWRQR